MLSSIFTKSLRDLRRSYTWWVIGVVLFGGFMMAFYPSFRDNDAFKDTIEAYPEDLMAIFGISSLEDITSPEGFLNTYMFGLTTSVLVFTIFAVVLGSGAVAGEEGRGTMEILISEPVTRWRVVMEKFAAMIVATVALGVVLLLVVLLGAIVVDMDISSLRIVETTVSLLLVSLTFGSIAFAAGCLTGSRSVAASVAAAVAVGTYLLTVGRELADFMDPAKWASPFYYYNGADPIYNGLNLAHASVLVAIILVFGLAAGFLFQRRDLRLG